MFTLFIYTVSYIIIIIHTPRNYYYYTILAIVQTYNIVPILIHNTFYVPIYNLQMQLFKHDTVK